MGTPFFQETFTVNGPPFSEKIMKSGEFVVGPSSKIMDPSLERAEEQFLVPELGALFLVQRSIKNTR